MQNLDTVKTRWLEAAAAAASPAALEEVRVKALGKSGEVSALMKGLGALSPDERREAGAQLNAVKDAVAAAIEARKAALQQAELDERLKTERVDVTLPARPEADGRLHPISQTIDEIVAIFGAMGFRVAEGPDIEDDFHNFTALNIPPEHPARQMQDTFYVAGADGTGGPGGKLLRTHTSPVQIRTMKDSKPPIRIIAPGRTYRVDSDATHSPMFHQVECLWIDEDISFADLKGVYTDFLRRFFEDEKLEVRFRPSYFPFTEPSAEIDMKLKGRWLEISGSGQVHPTVVKNFGLDPERYIGFAFGSGLERLTMLRYGIEDLRLFFDGDLRFLAQFP
jgi:phenylalanyl-tRNA synthetase alpha chain